MRNLFGCFGRRSSSSLFSVRVVVMRRTPSSVLGKRERSLCLCSERNRVIVRVAVVVIIVNIIIAVVIKDGEEGGCCTTTYLVPWYHFTTILDTILCLCTLAVASPRAPLRLYRLRTGNNPAAFGACRPSRKPPPNRRGNKSGAERTDAHHHHPPPPVLGTTTMMMRSLCATRRTRIKKSSSRKRL